jgi:hypothetical protein
MTDTISEEKFRALCEEVYRDRAEIYGFHPGAGRSEALLWMLLGCLISLLSVDEVEMEAVADSSGKYLYLEAVCALLEKRTEPHFNPRPYLEELAQRAESE